MQRLFFISGRANRREWWFAAFAPTLILIVLEVLVLLSLMPAAHQSRILSTLLVIADVLAVWIMFTTSVRRLHDRGETGWYMLLSLLPIIGNLWIIYACGFARGQPFANEYGEPTVPIE